LRKLAQASNVADIGCGKESCRNVKERFPEGRYVGLEIGDYDKTEISKALMDDYVKCRPEACASRIREDEELFGLVICLHNLVHCEKPYEVLEAKMDKGVLRDTYV